MSVARQPRPCLVGFGFHYFAESGPSSTRQRNTLLAAGLSRSEHREAVALAHQVRVSLLQPLLQIRHLLHVSPRALSTASQTPVSGHHRMERQLSLLLTSTLAG